MTIPLMHILASGGLKMYDVYFADKFVGKMTVRKSGLYYLFSGKFRFPEKGMYRIYASDGSHDIDLGICVPNDDCFTVFKSVPTKKFAGNILHFTALTSTDKVTFVPISEECPVDCLRKLRNCRYENRNGVAGILISEG